MGKVEQKREEFLDYVTMMVRWCDENNADKRTALEGLAHSILVAMDGGASGYRPLTTYLGGNLHEHLYGGRRKPRPPVG